MFAVPPEAIAIAQRQHGLITTADLVRIGVSKRHRSAMIATGMASAVHRGVYRFATHPMSFEVQCQAALLAAPDAALAGPTAGRWLGLRKVYTTEVHVLAARAIHLDGVTCHRSTFFAESDIGVVRGLRTLKPARLFCDLAWHLSEDDLESVLEQMLDRGVVSIGAVRAMARRFLASGRPGTVRLTRVLDGRPDWVKPAQSDLEVKVARRLVDGGLDVLRQFVVKLDDGTSVRLDLALPEVRVAIEIDHVTWHGGRLDAQRDKRRDRGLARLGWQVMRVTDDDVRNDLDAAVADIAHVVAARRFAA